MTATAAPEAAIPDRPGLRFYDVTSGSERPRLRHQVGLEEFVEDAILDRVS